ncbi:MAG: aminotransferase class I/II-fold pyridoxal phosphate-dependent enzyme [Alphaproteobacteria bacterium]|nr:aminotransferase class I/II-fold pyridoxal phosphate-dependent enzyme [Alphaproteobacteria bacterium]
MAKPQPKHAAQDDAPFDAETFGSQGRGLIETLTSYLSDVEKLPVLPYKDPAAMLAAWDAPIPLEGNGEAALQPFFERVIAESNHLHHPRYVGHQVSSPLPVAALCDLLSSFLNNGTAVYEMGQVSTVLERRLIEWYAALLGWDATKAGGVMTSGGSMGNLTALLAARQVQAEARGHNAWKEGMTHDSPRYAVMVCGQAHYCVARAAQIMGWGESGVIHVPADERYRLRADKLEETLAEAKAKGREVIAVVGSACSTANGAFDPLSEIAAFCKKHKLWFHIDAAHGGAAAMSEEYRHLLAGIEHADSVVWDAHKMMMVPALATLVAFRDKRHSYASFHQAASYLFTASAEEEWYNSGHRTIECTKNMMALKVYAPLMVYGQRFFGEYFARMSRLTAAFAAWLAEQQDFEIACAPQCNILCFRLKPAAVQNLEEINVLQRVVRAKILESGEFYLVQTVLDGVCWLRITVIHPGTSLEDLKQLAEAVRRHARESAYV